MEKEGGEGFVLKTGLPTRGGDQHFHPYNGIWFKSIQVAGPHGTRIEARRFGESVWRAARTTLPVRCQFLLEGSQFVGSGNSSCSLGPCKHCVYMGVSERRVLAKMPAHCR